MILVLWDIDRTLVYTGGTDREVYRELFLEVVGRPAEALPARGTGVTMPLAVEELLRTNGVPPADLERLAAQIIDRMPAQLIGHRDDILERGTIMPGAREALAAVQEAADMVPTVVTGNLRGSAEVKLSTLGLDHYVDLNIGGFASEDSHRPSLVRIAQERAAAKHGSSFTPENTVIIGDSMEDVRTGREGGAHVIGVASGTNSAETLTEAGATEVIPNLNDAVALLRLIHGCTGR